MKNRLTLLVVLVLISSAAWRGWHYLMPANPEISKQSTGEAPPKIPLAHLESFLAHVTHKRSDAQVWEDSPVGVAYFLWDAVQTHESAAAKILFTEGSRLDLREKTHIIITAPPSPAATPIQRTVVKNGRLKGRTAQTLWLISSNTLLELWARTRGEEAVADYFLGDNHKLAVTLEKGLGTIFQKQVDTTATLRKVQLVEGKTVELTVLEALDSLDWSESELASAEVSPARSQAALPPAFDFSVDLPADNSTVNRASLKLKGKVSREGGRLLVNGKEIKMAGSLEFDAEVKLVKGANRIIIQLVQPDGKSIYRQWVYIRRK